MKDSNSDAMKVGNDIHKAIESAMSDGTAMLVLDPKEGTVTHISREDFIEQVLGQPLPEHQRAIIKSCMDMDFESLENKIIAMQRGRNKSVFSLGSVGIRGIAATQIFSDECVMQGIDEQEIQVGTHLVKPNKRTKGKAHSLPFFLGSKRRF